MFLFQHFLKFLTPPYRAAVPMADLLYSESAYYIVNRPSELRRGRGGKNCRSGPKIFLCVLGTTEPNWFTVISAEIGACCRIPGHAIQHICNPARLSVICLRLFLVLERKMDSCTADY